MSGRSSPALVRWTPLILAVVGVPYCAALANDPYFTASQRPVLNHPISSRPISNQAVPEGAVLWASRAETTRSPANIPEETFRPLEPEEVLRPPTGADWPNAEPIGPWSGEGVDCVEAAPSFGERFWLPLGGWLSPDGRHRGWGDPLEGTSWLNRPYSFGMFTGGAFGDTLIEDDIEQRGGLLSGVRLGIDMHHYWGMDVRWAFSRADILFDQTGGVSTVDDMYLDAHLLYYPLGDAAWRPYFSLGLGLARFDYTNDQGVQVVETLAQMPFGGGVKYYLRNWMTVRFDITDNLAFGARDFSTVNNLSFTGGVEFRFGGRRTSYYPFDPSVHLR